jgi:hypothetical protein
LIDVLTTLRRLIMAMVGVAFLANAGLVAAAPLAAPASGGGPKVVIIVGPAGAATSYYRQLADDTANAAAKLTSNVVRVYSPDATWERVKAELQGASIVVYLGHGNGWPSRYHSALFPSTEDGFGLNPNAGAADAHQYFGETRIAAEIKLAKNAVVVFSHLCYASGNTEPGLPEGTLDQAQQRVDNYAAGFFAAGAGAVIADAYLAPKYYVTSVLKGQKSISAIWRTAPNRNDNFLAFNSIRTKGAIAEMDPDQASSGFHRSMVIRSGLTSDQVIGGSVGRPVDVTPAPEPSLVGLGVTFGTPDLSNPPTAGASTMLVLPVAKEAVGLLPSKLMIGTRWDRLDHPSGDQTDAAGNPTAAQGGSSSAGTPRVPAANPDANLPAASGAPSASGAPTPSGGPTASGAPAEPAGDPATPADAVPNPPTLVEPEVPGEVVAPHQAGHVATGGLSVAVHVPTEPGLYRLVATIHGSDGLAYDAATQALVPALVVRVTGSTTAAWSVQATATGTAANPLTLPVTVSNLGSRAWGHAASTPVVGGAESQPAVRAVVTASWIPLGASGGTPPASGGGPADTAVLPAALGPGKTATVEFLLTAPTAPGDYLLMFDVLDPDVGSLAALGVPPAIVRVTITP